MSMSPHQIFGRLQELKKWQQTHEKLLKRASVDEDLEKSPFNHPHSLNNSRNSGENHFENAVPYIARSTQDTSNPDEITGSPAKNFEELLEEKLNEYANNFHPSETINQRPKRPFLRKGTGLLKYNLKPEEYQVLIGNKYSNTIVPPKVRPKSVENPNKPVQNLPQRPKTCGGEKHSNFLRKSQNSTRTLKKTSLNSKQRPRTSGGEYSRKKVSLKENFDTQQSFQNVFNPKKSEEPPKNQVQNVIKNGASIQRPETDGHTIKKDSPKLLDFIETISKKPIEFTPLKAPEICIKPKTNWCNKSVDELQNDNFLNQPQWIDNSRQNDINSFHDVSTQVVLQSQWRNGVVRQINELASRMGEVDKVENVKHDFQEQRLIPTQKGARKSLSFESSDQSLYEKALETELMIFEALERRTEQSGFCSSNTSIIQLLASTPSKFNLRNTGTDSGSPVFKKIIDTNEDVEKQPVKDRNSSTPVHSDKFETPSSQPLHQFQFGSTSSSNWSPKSEIQTENHLIKEVEQEDDDDSIETEDEIDQAGEDNEDIYQGERFERKESSTNTENFGMGNSIYSSSSSDVSDGYSVESVKVTRNSRSPQSHGRSIDISDSCASCGCLIKKKIEECQSELNSLKLEKDRIVIIREQMAKDKKEFEKEMKTRRRQFEEQRLKFQLEIEEERKRISEKPIAEKPNKEAKSKTQHKKDREEINNLKMDLNEAKELMKLRETKNAMCIARLRNQVKLLEKNNAELKAENEKLLKEKSKLVAQQKTYNKSTETKMLKEISKNISKLTEETFKNQYFKTDTSSEDDLKRKLIKGGCGGDSENNSTKSLNKSQGLNKSVTLSCHGHGEGLTEKHPPQLLPVQNGVDKQLEEKYKSLFGGRDVIIEDASKNYSNHSAETTRPLGLGKSERLLEDGTKEITYSNGNKKLVSENGTVRYYYSSNDTWHTNFPDGTEVIEFPNGQSEKRFKDGKCLVFFPDGLVQTIFSDGTEEVKYPDGSKLLTKKDGDRMLFLSNGQVEIHTKDQKRREYPDGTVKILYPDGSQETRYSNGRVRMKNSKGEIILDTGQEND